MIIKYSKVNEVKERFNCKDWNTSEVQLELYNELDKAKSEGFVEAIDLLNNVSKDEIIVPKCIIENILRYCENQAVYDKLGSYGDFYYKLKEMVK